MYHILLITSDYYDKMRNWPEGHRDQLDIVISLLEVGKSETETVTFYDQFVNARKEEKTVKSI